ncbi:MAG: DUF6463 family protein [Cyclobacteriaceae bacterium]|nr:DUF6463 family protein [Cyclobacteriaceae bacterium]
MKITNGNLLVFTGIMHSLFGVLPFAFGKQFSGFMNTFFFKISNGLSEFPLLNGKMNYENFSAFWFFYFGLLLIPMGVLVQFLEKNNIQVPKKFAISYLVVVLVGVYMIPFSGMTIFMLPHAIYMVATKK